jgi:hypothetical protein
MATSNKPSSGIGLAIGALVVGVVVGLVIGKGGGGGGGAVPTPAPPVMTPTPATTPTPSGVGTLTYDGGASCFGPDTKNIYVDKNGVNSCYNAETNPQGNADVHPANPATVNWFSDPGTTLVIVFQTPDAVTAFKNLRCYANSCSIGQADPSYHLTPQPYAAYVYGKGTPTPRPGGSPTPKPTGPMVGHIIIKP